MRNHERQVSGREAGFCSVLATGRGEQGSRGEVVRRHNEEERIEQER